MDPQVVCTRIDLPEGHILSDSEVMRGEPEDGACDVVVYLPLVVGDSLLMGPLSERTQELQAVVAEVEQEMLAKEWTSRTCPSSPASI